MQQMRVLLADDSVDFLTSAFAFLAADRRVRVIGLARDGRDAVELAGELAPDLVLMDLTMPVMDGLAATRRIKAAPAPPRVVIVTLHDTDDYRQSAREAGTDGFICKSHYTEGVLAEVAAFFAELPGRSPTAGA